MWLIVDVAGYFCKQLANWFSTTPTLHKICNLQSSTRTTTVAQSKISCKTPQALQDVSNELDTHADTCALGKNFLQLYDTMQTVLVMPYNSQYKAVDDLPVVTAETAIQMPETGETVIIVINQGLWFRDSFENLLLNPNQLQYAGTEVNDNPFDKKGIFI